MEEVNWVPRSEVMVPGTPYRVIQVVIRAEAQAGAVVEVRGVAL